MQLLNIHWKTFMLRDDAAQQIHVALKSTFNQPQDQLAAIERIIASDTCRAQLHQNETKNNKAVSDLNREITTHDLRVKYQELLDRVALDDFLIASKIFLAIPRDEESLKKLAKSGVEPTTKDYGNYMRKKVANDILDEPDPKVRAVIFERYVALAVRSLIIGNLPTAAAIFSTLNNTPEIDKLKIEHSSHAVKVLFIVNELQLKKRLARIIRQRSDVTIPDFVDFMNTFLPNLEKLDQYNDEERSLKIQFFIDLLDELYVIKKIAYNDAITSYRQELVIIKSRIADEKKCEYKDVKDKDIDPKEKFQSFENIITANIKLFGEKASFLTSPEKTKERNLFIRYLFELEESQTCNISPTFFLDLRTQTDNLLTFIKSELYKVQLTTWSETINRKDTKSITTFPDHKVKVFEERAKQKEDLYNKQRNLQKDAFSESLNLLNKKAQDLSNILLRYPEAANAPTIFFPTSSFASESAFEKEMLTKSLALLSDKKLIPNTNVFTEPFTSFILKKEHAGFLFQNLKDYQIILQECTELLGVINYYLVNPEDDKFLKCVSIKDRLSLYQLKHFKNMLSEVIESLSGTNLINILSKIKELIKFIKQNESAYNLYIKAATEYIASRSKDKAEGRSRSTEIENTQSRLKKAWKATKNVCKQCKIELSIAEQSKNVEAIKQAKDKYLEAKNDCHTAEQIYIRSHFKLGVLIETLQSKYESLVTLVQNFERNNYFTKLSIRRAGSAPNDEFQRRIQAANDQTKSISGDKEKTEGFLKRTWGKTKSKRASLPPGDSDKIRQDAGIITLDLNALRKDKKAVDNLKTDYKNKLSASLYTPRVDIKNASKDTLAESYKDDSSASHSEVSSISSISSISTSSSPSPVVTRSNRANSTSSANSPGRNSPKSESSSSPRGKLLGTAGRTSRRASPTTPRNLLRTTSRSSLVNDADRIQPTEDKASPSAPLASVSPMPSPTVSRSERIELPPVVHAAPKLSLRDIPELRTQQLSRTSMMLFDRKEMHALSKGENSVEKSQKDNKPKNK